MGTLYEKLQKVSSEEDVKDIYINALGLTAYQKNLIDIQTKEIWFEAKDGYKHTTYETFTQLLHYVKQATNEGEYVAPFLCVIDERSVREKYKLGRQDVGWYQVRNALKERHSLGQQRVDFSDFQSTYAELTDKLRKQVHSLGFIS